jgi:hypothetical protein
MVYGSRSFVLNSQPKDNAMSTSVYRRIGAPNSIARYACNTSWGDNDWAVFEYGHDGMPIVRAAGSKEHCEKHLRPNRMLVDVRGYKKDYENT